MDKLERINLLIREGEGLTIEFKEHFTPRIAEDMVAFANTRGGTIILGVRDNRIKDDLITQFNAAVTFIKKHINRRSIIEGTLRRDVYEVPEPVIREAVANAIVHRDYAMTGTDITVSIFDDRLEIKNPGGLPTGVTEKNLGKISIRRNPLLSEMFNRIDIIEKAGTGFGRMREALLGEGFPEPEIQNDSFFFISFKRVYNLELVNTDEPGTAMAIQSSVKSSVKIIELIKDNPQITIPEMAENLRLTTRAVEKNIAVMKKSGQIRRSGPDKGGVWEVLS